MPDVLQIACIGFGEAASAFVSGWGAVRGVTVKAYDVRTDHPDEAVRAAKRADYERAGVIGCGTLAEALDGAGLVFSLVTADQAAGAALAAAPLLGEGALFLDGNSCSPDTKRRAAAAVAAGRGLYVDLAIMAPVHPELHKTPLLVSGEHATAAAERLRALGMEAAVAAAPDSAADKAPEGMGHAPAPAPAAPPAPDYADIPGTFVFDADRSRRGYHLNMFCMSLRHAANRAAFKADEAGYLSGFPMTEEQRRAVLARDWNEMLRLGGNIYYTSKLAATDGINFQQLAARMTGVSDEEYRAMMLGGGRPITGNRSVKEWGNG